MATTAVTAPLEKLRKIRSLDEIRTRGRQAFSAYREQRLGAGELPSDEKFLRVIDAAHFNGTPILAETLWQKFYKNGAERFFPVFGKRVESTAFFRSEFGPAADQFI